ncbi:hypothetical protein [Mucilaginibacter sp.]|uniref:hypothetical protein n=1 Tax=Mucilaginibacter sp. TaxID=1882438 RepID=UPI003263BCA6
MKKHHLLVVLLTFITLMYSCSKDGLVGPEGPAGPDGATGAAGPVGAAGADGSIIYSGTTAPALATGKAGDYFLNRSTGQLYGPKVAAGWGNPINLIGTNGTNGTNGANGTDGTDGENGSTTLSGSGAPSSGIGIIGDYYLDKTNYMLYGPKSNTGWDIPILLRGANGAQGPAGAAGKDGSIIYSGFGAPVANIGSNGDYYLDRNTGQLYGPKTNTGWGTPIVLKGTDGTDGAVGSNGQDGTNGQNGTNGINGTNGSVTLSGNGAPATNIGVNGDYYLDKQNYLLYGPKVAAGWGVPILLRGADGAQGPAGPAGADGTVIYSGDYDPAPALGKIGDFYFAKMAKMMFGPKIATGWGMGVSLVGANGANGTSGSTVLSGFGPPPTFEETGKPGDFYINTDTYEIYGPKVGSNWGSPTSLKGADGNANIKSFETSAQSTFIWAYGGFDDFTSTSFAYLRMNRNITPNDTTTLYTIPGTALGVNKSGLIMVYLHNPVSANWYQLAYTTNTGDKQQNYTYQLNTAGTDGIVRINVQYGPSAAAFLNVDKVRIVVAPASSLQTLSAGRQANRQSMEQLMQQYRLKDSDFVILK